MNRYLILLLTLASLSATACCAVRNVPAQYPTIQAGINAAVNGDTVLVADGTYTGSGNKNLDFSGKNIVVLASGGPEACYLSLEYNGRGFNFHSGESSLAVVSGFTIFDGSSSSNGGGIAISSSSPTITHCVIWNCSTPSNNGGGIYISNGSPLIINCTIVGNSAYSGGAVYAADSDMTLVDNVIVFNQSTG